MKEIVDHFKSKKPSIKGRRELVEGKLDSKRGKGEIWST